MKTNALDVAVDKIGSLEDKRSVSKRDSWSYDPEAVFGQCAGQWVVCLTQSQCWNAKSSPLPHGSVGSTERGVGAREMGTAHCMEIGGQKPRSPFSLAPQSPFNICLLEDKLWGLPVRRGRTPAQNKKQTNNKPISCLTNYTMRNFP